jgi:hypothetical protein
VAKGISSLGSNVGLAASIGAVAGSVTKGIAKSSLPPVQKAGLAIAGGLAGAVLHVGASAINAQTHAAAQLKSTNNTNTSSDIPQSITTTSDLIPKGINKLVNSNDLSTVISPLETLL